jgi:copper transport protein
VLALVATGAVAAITHLPTLAALWETGYGRSILVKLGLLAAALVLGAVNLLVTTPRLTAAGLRGDDAFGGHAAALLRRTVTGEITLVASTVFAAGVLTSLPPPAAALSKAGDAVARVGPGPVSRSVVQHDTRVVVTLTPNRAVWPTTLGVALTRRGVPVAGASVIARFDMLDMDMGQRAYVLKERTPGTYQRSAVALLMVGTWGVTFEVTPKAGRPFSFLVVDKANG